MFNFVHTSLFFADSNACVRKLLNTSRTTAYLKSRTKSGNNQNLEISIMAIMESKS